MKKIIALISIIAICLTTTSCFSVNIHDYKDKKPQFIPQQFFNGKLTAKGVVKNRSGKVTRAFTADINAYWENNVGTLEEKFIFDDGEIQYRTWKIQTQNPTNSLLNYTATAGDVIGTGEGKAIGNAFNVKYVLNVKYNDSTINVGVDDWMWLLDDKTVLNESELTKFGFKVGSIQLVMIKN